MELSERYIKTLEKEGFANVYEWQDPAGTVYDEHAHDGKVALMVTDGSVTVVLRGNTREIAAGERINIPSGVPHSAVVGPTGWIAIIGEEEDGDSCASG